jgi:4-amino-4-deoxy-L-arabinose transferase-like glycosyltransferase
MLEGPGWITTPLAVREPLYPALMALAYALPGPDIPWLLGLQALLGVAVACLVTAGLWPHLRPGAATIAGILVAVNPHFLFHATLPVRETLVTFLVTALVVSVVRWGFSGRDRWVAATAVIGVLLVHADVRYLPLLALPPAMAVICGGMGRARRLVLYASVVLLGMIPYQVRGLLAFGKPVVVTERFLDRWLPWAGIEITGTTPPPDPGAWLAEWTAERASSRDSMSVEEARAFDAGMRPAMDRAGIYRYRFLTYWSFLHPRADYAPFPDGRFTKPWSLRHSVTSTLVVVPFLVLLPFTWWWATRPERRVAAAFLLFLVAHTAIHVVVHAQERYRIPVEGLMAVMVAVALVGLGNRVRRREEPSAADGGKPSS